MQFGEILRLLMEESNVKPKQLAKDLRISITMMNSYIRCQQVPDFDLLKRIAAYFDVSTDDLLDYQGAAMQPQSHIEDDLLRVFRSLPLEQRRVFLEQGKVATRLLGEHLLKYPPNS
jgi:transcriptional regulator with XRE-family HTH domain